METNLRHLVRLNLTRRIAARGRQRLMDRLGALERAFAAPEAVLAEIVGAETAKALKATTEADVDLELRRAASLGATIIGLGASDYPARLAQITDPPLVLYVRGDLCGTSDEEAQEDTVAVVGARRATPYGLRLAEDLARGLAAAGKTVVSGLARGIDAAAHRGTIAAGGRTIAVLGSGIDRPYPPEHEGLAEDIVRTGGAVVSELPCGSPPLAFHFPRRNRIVSGLSLGVVVVEAAERSGSLITVGTALEQGREVGAVPGRVGEESSAGCNRLIQEGAALIQNARDILRLLGKEEDAEEAPPAGRAPGAPPAGLSPEEERVYSALTTDPLHIDDVIETSGLPVSMVFSTLTALELRRAVKSWPGKLYQKV